jgi:alpha-mannosidase
MLKHPDLTRQRIEQFLRYELQEKVLGERHPLEVEFCREPHPTEALAAKGPWERVEKGFRYGPAYRTFWFRLTGRVPKSMAGMPVGALAELGSERTVWKNDSPWLGVDHKHEVVPISDSARTGQPVSLMVQAYSRNAQVTVHRPEQPREELVETVEFAELAAIDRGRQQLAWDVEFGLSLLAALDERTPEHAVLLRALNNVCNAFSDEAATIVRCSKILRSAIANMGGDVHHAITAVGHAHLDTAWLWPLEITMKKMAHTTATQLHLIERYPEYVFVHSQASQYEWLEKQYPALFERVKKAIKKGQWEPVGSMWVEADCNLSGGESLVRQFLYGRRYFRDKLGHETHDMWLPDVFGYSAALPQILNKFGIRYFLTQKISWNQFNKFPHHTFWWQGIDGSRIWTHFPPADTYCGSAEPKEILESVRKYKDHARSDQSMYVFGYGDGGGGPTERHLELLRRARSAPSVPVVHSGRKALDFFRDAKARSRDLPVWAGELYFELHRGTYTSQAATKKGNRECESLLRDAEWLSCFRDGFPRKYPAAELEEAWKIVLLNQFHDIIPGSSVREVYEDAERDYDRARSIAGRIIQEALQAVGSKLESRRARRPVALFQNATVTTEGSIPWTEGEAPASLAIGDEALPVQLVEGLGQRRLAFPVPQAALGTVAVADLSDRQPNVKLRLKASSRKIENAELAVRFDGNGNITSIQSLEDGAEYVAPGKLANLFQLLEDKPLFWDAWDLDLYSFETAKDLVASESFEIVERGPVRVAAQIVKKFGKSTIRQRISLGPTPGIRFDTEVDWHEDHKMLKVAFPLNLNANRATYEIQFGHVERPTHANTSWDLARFEVCAQKWADLGEGDSGVALLNDCKYGHDARGNVLRLSLLRSPKAPDPQCDMGRHAFTYVLMPHFGPLQYAGVVQAAYALNAPLRHAFLEPGPGAEGQPPAFLHVDDRNIVIEAAKRAEDGGGIVVRMYECHNARGHAELACARKPKEAWLCDLEEKPVAELEVVDGVIPFSYKPFEILTVKLVV